MKSPILVVNYTDPIESNVRGYLVINDFVKGLAAGGMRIQKGLTAEVLIELARNMSAKQQAVGIDVGGAKSGLDMDPQHPRRAEIVARFFETLKPLITNCYNMGPDLNNTMAELETYARKIGIPSLKIAVGRCRGLSDAEFLKRYDLFETRVDSLTVNQLRAPQAVASSVLSLLKHLDIPFARATVAIQGAGNMGLGSASLLRKAGVSIVAWADQEKCLLDPQGLAVSDLIPGIQHGILPKPEKIKSTDNSAILGVTCHVLVLAATSRVFGASEVPKLACQGIVQGANLALEEPVENLVHSRGILNIPDLIASAGGSIAVQSLYSSHPTKGQDILDFVARRVDGLCQKLFLRVKEENKTPRALLRSGSL